MQAFEPMQRSSTDFESTPAVSELMQSYFLKLLARYREFVEPDYLQGGQDAGGIRSRNGAAGEDDSGYLKCDMSAAEQAAVAVTSAQLHCCTRVNVHQSSLAHDWAVYSMLPPQALPCLGNFNRAALQACTAQHLRRGATAAPWLPAATQASSVMQHCDNQAAHVAETMLTAAGASQGKQAARAGWPKQGRLCRAYGYRFDHRALVLSHKRQPTRTFLDYFRHSQMYEVLPWTRTSMSDSSCLELSTDGPNP